MANIQTAPNVRKQYVYSESRRIFVETYLTAKGKRLLASATTKEEKDAINAKYSKNRYRINKDARVVKVIIHYINPVQL